MDSSQVLLLAMMIGIIALLYSSIGHGGASGYLASMALFGIAPQIMKPSALVLNLLVSSIATFSYFRTGGFSWKVFWPFALSSVPFALWGSTMLMPDYTYKLVLGLTLVFASYRVWNHRKK